MSESTLKKTNQRLLCELLCPTEECSTFAVRVYDVGTGRPRKVLEMFGTRHEISDFLKLLQERECCSPERLSQALCSCLTASL